MRTRVATFDFTKSFLLLGSKYYYDNNQLIKVKFLTNNEKWNAGPKPVILLIKVIKVGEMILV